MSKSFFNEKCPGSYLLLKPNWILGLNFFIERYIDAYNIQLKELISLHKNKIKSRSTFEDGYIALKLANAAYKSLRLKKTIKV